MAKSCRIIPHVKNKSGEEVESTLYNDLNALMTSTNNGGRLKVLPLYQHTLGEQFKKDAKENNFTFDDNGEVTLYSFVERFNGQKYKLHSGEEVEFSISDSQLINYLNQKFGFLTKNSKQTMSRQEALDAIDKFNDSDWGKKFTATLSMSGNSFTVDIQNINQDYQRRTKFFNRLNKRLSKILEGWGIAIDDLNDLEAQLTNGYTDFSNIGKLPDGLIHLIKLAKGSIGEKALPEEFAHFVVRALKDSPLISRAMAQLKQNENYKTVLGEEFSRYNQEYNGNEDLLAEEALGKILAQKIQNEFVSKSLIDRIKNLFNKVFGRFNEETIQNITLDVDEDLNVLAQDILDGKYKELKVSESSIKLHQLPNQLEKDHLQTRTRWEKFYETMLTASAIYEKRRKNLSIKAETKEEAGELVGEQSELLRELEVAANIDKEDLTQDTPRVKFIKEILNGRTKEEFRIDVALKLVSHVINDTKNIQKTVNELREQVESGSYKGSLNTACSKIKSICAFLEAYEGLTTDYDKYIKSTFDNSELNKLPEIDKIRQELISQLKTLKEQISDIRTAVFPKQEDLQHTYTDEDFDADRPLAFVVFENAIKQFVPEGVLINMMTNGYGAAYTLSELLRYSPNDISIVSCWLNSMANTSDEIARIYDYIVKKQKDEARFEALSIQRKIKAAGVKLEKFGFSARDHSWMYAKDENGHFKTDSTGVPLYISDYDQKAADSAYKLYKGQVYNKYKDLSFEERQKKVDEAMEEYKNKYYEKRRDGWYPKREYFPSKEFEALSDAQKEFYHTFMECKRQLDKYIPMFTTDSRKAIMVRKSGLQRILTMKGEDVTTLIQSIKDWWGDIFKKNETDDEFGMMSAMTDFRNREMKQIPIYHTRINTSKPMHIYSTNLVANMCMYAETATRYKAMAKVIDTLELGRDLMENRLYSKKKNGKALYAAIKSGNTTLFKQLYEDKQKNHSQTEERLTKFLDMQVYGELKTGVAAKQIGLWARLVGLFTTAINILVGITNVFQGLGQIHIEALAGQHFNVGDLIKANAYYFYKIVPTILESFRMQRNYKLSLLSEEFNVMQEHERDVKDVNKYEKNPLYRFDFGSTLYLLNHMGEHYMQHVTFLASLNHQKLKTKDGKYVSVLDAYTAKPLDPDNPSLGSYLTLKTYDMEGKQSQMYYTQDGKTIVTMEQLKARQESMQKKGKNVDLYSKALLWNDNEIPEYEFKGRVSRKAAKLNQDMHGIYNEDDKNVLQQKSFGALVMMYRKHIMPNFMKRFKTEYYDTDLETFTKGYQRDFYKKFLKIYASLFYFKKENNGKKWAFLTLTSQERYNALRHWGQIANWLEVNLAINLLEAFGDDDDDDLWYRIVLTCLYRAKTENSQFEPLALFSKHSLVNEWLRLAEQPIVGISIIDKYLALTELLNPDNYTETISRGQWKGCTKAERIWKEAVPGFKQMHIFKDPSLDYFRGDVSDWWNEYLPFNVSYKTEKKSKKKSKSKGMKV